MRDSFVDTSVWAAWADRNEEHHDQALAVVRGIWDRGGKLITTSYVPAELPALLTRPMRVSKSRQIELLDDLRSDPSVEVVPIDADLKSASWALWRGRPDKDWSLVDSASFVVMQRLSLTEALASDHHFEQAGFIRLLK